MFDWEAAPSKPPMPVGGLCRLHGKNPGLAQSRLRLRLADPKEVAVGRCPTSDPWLDHSSAWAQPKQKPKLMLTAVVSAPVPAALPEAQAPAALPQVQAPAPVRAAS